MGRINVRGEADLLKQLHHEYLPQVYDFIQVGSQVFTVIDYVEGCPLFLLYREKAAVFPETDPDLGSPALSGVGLSSPPESAGDPQ